MSTTEVNSTCDSGNGLDSQDTLDLVGGPFSVIESDPGVFTTLIRKLGIRHLQFEEVYDIQSPLALSSIKPKGLVLCFMWKHDKHHPTDFDDPAAKQVWFANQLSDDSCASLAIMNVLFNCTNVDVGEELRRFREETDAMSSVMKGLAITNFHLLRKAQNSLARPSDLWASLSSIAKSTSEQPKAATSSNATATTQRKPPKRARTNFSAMDPRTVKSRSQQNKEKRGRKKSESQTDTDETTYHFIGYVPAHGKVWELDGFKVGPLEVGEIPAVQGSLGGDGTDGWEEVVLPALKLKMEKYGSSADGNIQFSLLALVEDRYEAKSDAFELERRSLRAVERRLVGVYGEAWKEKVHPDLLASHADLHDTPAQTPFRQDFALQQQNQDLHILGLPEDQLIEEWEDAVRRSMEANAAVKEEVEAAKRTHTEHVKRTHNYDKFVREFIGALNEEGILSALVKG